MKANINQKVALKKRISKVHSKAEAVGFFYLIGTLLLAVVSFFPFLYGTSVGDMGVINFWKPFLKLTSIKTSAVVVLVDAFVALLYALLLLTVVINVLRSLAKLSRLFKKKASRVNGYNRNAIAMEELGKIYSGTYCVFIAFPFMIHLISGAVFSNLYYIAVAIGLVLHFWLGLVGGNVSTFSVEQPVEEEPRVFGRIAPFFRNLAQIVFVGVIMYFISQTNLMLNVLKVVETNDVLSVFKNGEIYLFQYLGIPGLQLLCCIWTLVLLKHATATTEYDREGRYASGMKNFCVFSVLLLITSGVLFGLMFIAHSKSAAIVPVMGTLYIAVVALAAVIEEACMCRLPNVKGAVAEEPQAEASSEAEDEPAAAAAEQQAASQPAPQPVPQPPIYRIPLQCISQPGVYMQPNGQPVMVMPMVAGPQFMPGGQQPVDGRQIMYGYNNPYANPYMAPYGYQYWADGKPFNPYQYVQEQTETAEETKAEESATAEEGKQEERKLTVQERKANLAADKKALRREAALSRKENRIAAERSAVEKALAEKWIKKAGVQPAAEQPATIPAEQSPVAQQPAAEQTAIMPVQQVPLQPVEEAPRKAEMETYSYSNPFEPKPHKMYPEATELTEEDLMKPLPPKKWTVTCPDCRSKLTVKDGAFAYRCPECGGVFQLRKIFRSRQNTGNTENK